MTAKPIPTYRAAHFAPFLALLRELGAPVESSLRRARLPITLVDQAEARLPLLQTLNFVSDMAHSQDIDDLALRAREHARINQLSPALQNTILAAPTLKLALASATRLATKENSTLDIWMVADRSMVRICNTHRIPVDMKATRHLELNTSMWLLAIVRAYAGPQWFPEEMAFHSGLPLGRFASEHLPDTRFRVGQPMAWFAFPRAMLCLPPRALHAMSRSLPPTHASQADSVDLAPDFPTSLKIILGSYLRDGYPDINLAAEIANTSVRSLQRRLGEAGLGYSDLIQQVRFEAAAQLLRDSDISLTDIAYDLGFSEPSSFSRAFSKIAGISPREYRRQQYPHQAH